MNATLTNINNKRIKQSLLYSPISNINKSNSIRSVEFSIKTMKTTIILPFILLLILTVTSIKGDYPRRSPYQRLVTPGHGTRMTIAPGLCLPNIQMSTVESAMEMRMPISVNFPTAGEVAATFLNQALALPVGAALSRQESGTNSSFSSFPFASTLSASSKSASNKASSRESRAMNSRIAARQDFYNTVEKAHPTFGKSCLLRAICEVSEVPFVSAHTGFIGEMFDILLTVSPLLDREGKLAEYVNAERVGRRSLIDKSDQCKKKYSNCPFSLFKVAQLANTFL